MTDLPCHPEPLIRLYLQVSQYFHLEESGAGAAPQKATVGYSCTVASSFIRNTPNFQHDFKGNGSGQNTKSPASWDQESRDRGHGGVRPAGAWKDSFPPKLERKVSQVSFDVFAHQKAIADGIRIMANDTVNRTLSVIHWNVQDDSLHDYYGRSSKIRGGRRYGTTIDYGHQPPRFVQ